MTANAVKSPAEVRRPAPDRSRVLTRAVVRAAGLLGINQASVARMLGISTSTASRMFSGQYVLDPSRKEWEFASLFLRVFRSLDSIVGGSEIHARAWMTGESRTLGGRPLDLLSTTEGLVRVVHYLDAARGRI